MQQPNDQQPQSFFCGYVPGSGWVITRERDDKKYTLETFFEEFGHYPPRPIFFSSEQRHAWEEYQPPGDYCVIERNPEDLAIALTENEEEDTILFTGTEAECEEYIKDYFATVDEDVW